ncbi:DMT family transporter [Staphylococcus succinus]|uniref:DMT family transporter n=1 Tax=Staphylococcus TaxID=1279 RepID=UPI00062B7C14|nr:MULTISPECIES: DMT family transporter [Staphylococcus]MDH9161354.1 DMT family transporter [Staphylococcus succinus]MEB8125266.1 DMT family transporter [Staphylococcus succinus]OIJ30194.1 EamA family transporter [Staphylococcus sp. LCT-H4]PNZ16606.1 EamA/RhaT family transporter [Staphylococcus succinus subsp. succinus]
MNYIQNKGKVYFAFTITIILWASAFPVIKLALSDFSAVHLSSLRLSIASLILLILIIIKKIPIPDFKDIPIILLLGFCGFTLYHIALSFGEYYVSAGISSLIVSTTPIFSALLATYFLKEKFSKLAWIGSVIAFIGVACIALGNDSKVIAMCIGIALVLIASIGESIYFVFQSSYFKKYGFIPFTIYTMLAGSLFTFIFLPGAIHELQYADTNTLLLVLYLGVFPTVIPYFALAYTIYKVGVADATMSLYLTPACALVLSFIMVGEMPTMVAIIGGIVTLIGVSITTNHAKNIG